MFPHYLDFKIDPIVACYMVPIPKLIGGWFQKREIPTDLQAIFSKNAQLYEQFRSSPIENLFWIPEDPNPVASTLRREKRFVRLLTSNAAICAKN